MAYSNQRILRDADGHPIPQMWDSAADSFVPVQKMEYYGRSIADRPPANTVPVGAIFMIVGDFETIWQSNGTEWVVIA